LPFKLCDPLFKSRDHSRVFGFDNAVKKLVNLLVDFLNIGFQQLGNIVGLRQPHIPRITEHSLGHLV